MEKILKIFLVLSLLAGTAESAAVSLEQKKSEYDLEAEKAKRAAEDLQIKIDSVSKVKRELDEAAAEAIFNYEEKQAALDKTLSEIAENEKKLSDLNEQYEGRQKIFEKRVRDIYINGQISYVDVIFGAKDFGDFLTRMDLLKRILNYDSELINSLTKYQEEVHEIVEKLTEEKKVEETLAMKAEQAKNIKLEKVAAQQEIIDRMENDKEVYNRRYDEMMAASQEVARLIEESHFQVAAEVFQPVQNDSSGYVTASNKMIFPVQGEITSPFGWRTHPIFGNQRYHSGMDIAADYGDEIHAAQSGVVITAGWIDGYGNTVMIDHGGGIVSLYGHNQSLAVNVGQNVKQGQVIAYCGSTGNSTGPHCHFEVRLNGEAVSPQDYM